MADPRTIVVTGGTGALGRANVHAFLEAGDRLVVPWIVKAERDDVAALWSDEIGAGRVTLVEADVAEEAGADAVARAAGATDVLVNGVGGFGGGAPVWETDLALWDHLYRINVRTVAAMSRALLSDMRARGKGAIVNVASKAAVDCPATIAAYSASKAAVAALTRSLQNEVADTGIRVNAVVPTTIDTPANREGMPDADFSAWTAPAEIAKVVLWLASDAATTVRGSLVDV